MALSKSRISLYLDDEVYDYVKKEAEESGVSMSAFINMAIKRYRDEQSVIKSLPQLMQSIQKLGEVMEERK